MRSFFGGRSGYLVQDAVRWNWRGEEQLQALVAEAAAALGKALDGDGFREWIAERAQSEKSASPDSKR